MGKLWKCDLFKSLKFAWREYYDHLKGGKDCERKNAKSKNANELAKNLWNAELKNANQLIVFANAELKSAIHRVFVFRVFYVHRVTRYIYYSNIPRVETFANYIWWQRNSSKLFYSSYYDGSEIRQNSSIQVTKELRLLLGSVEEKYSNCCSLQGNVELNIANLVNICIL